MRIFGVGLLVALCMCLTGRTQATAMVGPGGSYAQSCISIRMNGEVLSANCQDVAGQYHPSAIDVSRCPDRLIANNNGVLVCGRGGYGISTSLPRGSWR